MITSAKIYNKNKNKKQRKKNHTDRTLGEMVKGKLYSPNHTKKHTHTHSQKERKEKKVYMY